MNLNWTWNLLKTTKVIVLVPKHIRDSLSSNIVNLDGSTLASSTAVRNLGIIFDQDLSFYSYVKQVEVELSAIKPLSYGTIFQSWYGRQTHSLTLRVGLKASFLIKLIIRAGLSKPYLVMLL